jgi:hypothetical protein
VIYLLFALLLFRGPSAQKSACSGFICLRSQYHVAQLEYRLHATCGSTLVEGFRSPLAHVAINMCTLQLPRARRARVSHFCHTATSGVPAILRYTAVPT